MKDHHDMTVQEQLDAATDELGDVIRRVGRLARQAEKEASARCRGGQFALSADIGEIGAHLDEAKACLKRAYHAGRRLNVPTPDGVITPKSGTS